MSMICPSCGEAIIDENPRMCPHCGIDFNSIDISGDSVVMKEPHDVSRGPSDTKPQLGSCDFCDGSWMPSLCNFCRGSFCPDHTEPDSHWCLASREQITAPKGVPKVQVAVAKSEARRVRRIERDLPQTRVPKSPSGISNASLMQNSRICLKCGEANPLDGRFCIKCRNQFF
jgi:hypothetical protein